MLRTPEQEVLSNRSLIARASHINTLGRKSVFAEAMLTKRTEAQQRFLQGQQAITALPFERKVEFITYLVGMVCIYGIDVLLFGPAAEYVAVVLGAADSATGAFVKWLVPAFFLGIEVLISLQYESAKHAEQFAFGSRAARRGWLCLGIIVALVMPLAARATAEAAGVVASGRVSTFMIAVLAIVSFAAHILVLFGGRIAQEAKTYLLYLAVKAFHAHRVARAAHRLAKLTNELTREFIAYVHAWRLHQARHAYVPSGPFDSDVVELLVRLFPHAALRPEPGSPVELMGDEA